LFAVWISTNFKIKRTKGGQEVKGRKKMKERYKKEERPAINI
jgi:hypothetical protein